jgi:hypothetical protein
MALGSFETPSFIQENDSRVFIGHNDMIEKSQHEDVIVMAILDDLVRACP